MTARRLTVWALEGIPEVTPGDDLVELIARGSGPALEDGDILVVTSKIVSKAEGRILHADDREDAITRE
ncbi:MAG: coenzyme F420-0:L-glutamate ligase, partial [Actinobacteria bacterium]|nr:coenzyme F420-0:L-glutamate ligase [Actinomycetota bacterium]